MVTERGQAAAAFAEAKGRFGPCQPLRPWSLAEAAHGRPLRPKHSIITFIDFIYCHYNNRKKLITDLKELTVINIALTVSAKTLHLHIQLSCMVFAPFLK